MIRLTEREHTDMKVSEDVRDSIIIIIIFAVVFGTVVSMYWSSFHSPEREVVERYVLEKQSKKGLFLGPRYQIITDNDTYGSFVTKKEFESLAFGDTISGYATNEYSLFTKMDELL